MSEHQKNRAEAAKTSFGFARVGEEAKQGLVNEVFAKVAPRYDLMNDLMSGGLHRLWKDDLVAWLAPPKSASPFALLDVAGGTGDVALRALKAGGAGALACQRLSSSRSELRPRLHRIRALISSDAMI